MVLRFCWWKGSCVPSEFFYLSPHSNLSNTPHADACKQTAPFQKLRLTSRSALLNSHLIFILLYFTHNHNTVSSDIVVLLGNRKAPQSLLTLQHHQPWPKFQDVREDSRYPGNAISLASIHADSIGWRRTKRRETRKESGRDRTVWRATRFR